MVTAALLPSAPGLAPDARAQVERDVAAFLAGQVASLPTLLRIPYRVALAAFDLLPLVRRRRTFRQLDGVARAAWLDTWTERRGLATRNFVKLLRSCALLAYFDHPLVAAELASATRPGAAA